MKDTFVVKQDLSFSEYFSVYLYTLARAKVFRFIIAIPIVLILINVMVNYTSPLKGETSYSWILPSLIGIIFPFAFFGVIGFLVFGSVFIGKRKYFRNVTYTFTHWGMEKKGIGFELTTQWNRFIKIKETKKIFLLIVSANDAHIIQKRMMTYDEVMDFRTFIRERLPADLMR